MPIHDNPCKWEIRVGLASCGMAAGGQKVYDAFVREVNSRKLSATVKKTGCIGMCYREVLVEVASDDGQHIFYGSVLPEQVERIIDKHLVKGEPVSEFVVPQSEIEHLFSKQLRIVLRNCGNIDPENIEEYVSAGGYRAIEKVLADMSPQNVIDEIAGSGLRGRGGAGFLTGMKWKFARKTPSNQKYLVCNADEGDPGAFMDRSVLEGDPHSVLEGMLIAGYAIGATEGFIYCRAEKPLAIQRIKTALEQSRDRGFVGENILGHDFDFNITIREGAGAFVCGEETALMLSIEGKRGMPRVRPPFPTDSGIWGKPTVINNVETLANIPWIITHGADTYSSYGTLKSKGTKVFALAGKVARGGLIEVPMGITLKEVVFDIGGGTPGGQFKAVQMGGPSGGIIPAHLMDTPIDYESLSQTGAIMGSGGLIVMDETACMVDVARFFLNFIQTESCGKCTFCRIGTLRMLEILDRITGGEGLEGDLDLLAELALGVKQGSLCGLGQTAANPVLTTLRYFRDEYEVHIKEKRCPAKKCRALLTYEIVAEKCRGCGLCARYCPRDAIPGEIKHPYRIDPKKCIRCGLCASTCRFNAISVR